MTSNTIAYKPLRIENRSIDVLVPYERNSKIHDKKQVIKAGLLPKQINKELKSLEENGNVAVTPFDGKERKRKGYYLNYDKYKAQDRIVPSYLRKDSYGAVIDRMDRANVESGDGLHENQSWLQILLC